MNKETKKSLAFLFGRNKKVNAYYQTSDGQFFSEKHFAEAHAAELKDKTITPYTRKDLIVAEKIQHLDGDKFVAKSEPIAESADQSEQAESKEAVESPVTETADAPVVETVEQPEATTDQVEQTESKDTVETPVVETVEAMAAKPAAKAAAKGKSTKSQTSKSK